MVLVALAPIVIDPLFNTIRPLEDAALRQRVLAWAGRGGRFRRTGPADMAAVPLVLLVFFVLSLVSLPLQNAISRRMEAAADRTALELTHDPAAFIRSEVQLARAGLADLAPPRAVVLLLYTHPPTVERIRMAESFAARQGAQP